MSTDPLTVDEIRPAIIEFLEGHRYSRAATIAASAGVNSRSVFANKREGQCPKRPLMKPSRLKWTRTNQANRLLPALDFRTRNVRQSCAAKAQDSYLKAITNMTKAIFPRCIGFFVWIKDILWVVERFYLFHIPKHIRTVHLH